MRSVEERLRGLRAEVDALHEDDKRHATRLQAADDALEEAEPALSAAAQARDGALQAFRRLGPAGVLALALAEHAPTRSRRGAGLVAHARAGAAACTARRSAAGALEPAAARERRSRSARASSTARSASRAELSVVTEQSEDGVVLAKVREGAIERPVSDLAARLEGEIADRERTLTAEQRRVFSDAPLEEIADHLRERIDRVDGSKRCARAVRSREPPARQRPILDRLAAARSCPPCAPCCVTRSSSAPRCPPLLR